MLLCFLERDICGHSLLTLQAGERFCTEHRERVVTIESEVDAVRDAVILSIEAVATAVMGKDGIRQHTEENGVLGHERSRHYGIAVHVTILKDHLRITLFYWRRLEQAVGLGMHEVSGTAVYLDILAENLCLDSYYVLNGGCCRAVPRTSDRCAVRSSEDTPDTIVGSNWRSLSEQSRVDSRTDSLPKSLERDSSEVEIGCRDGLRSYGHIHTDTLGLSGNLVEAEILVGESDILPCDGCRNACKHWPYGLAYDTRLHFETYLGMDKLCLEWLYDILDNRRLCVRYVRGHRSGTLLDSYSLMRVHCTCGCIKEALSGFHLLASRVGLECLGSGCVDASLLQVFANSDKLALFIFGQRTSVALTLQLLESHVQFVQLFLFLCHS
nr:MAG TPA: hypothetical protein [Caudoviricetes sp.]